MLEIRDARRTPQAAAMMVRPGATYARAVAASATASWPQALSGPVRTAMVMGIVTAVAAAGRVPLTLVVSQVVCWSFVPLLQCVTASALIGASPGRRVTFGRAFELLFAAHGPWSAWLIAVAAMQLLLPSQYLVILTAALPAAWTALMLAAFGREVLGLSPWAARFRVVAHQLATMLLIVGYIEITTRVSMRLAALQS